jgi:hypothetical protein
LIFLELKPVFHRWLKCQAHLENSKITENLKERMEKILGMDKDGLWDVIRQLSSSVAQMNGKILY